MSEALTMRRGLLQMLQEFRLGSIDHVLVTTFNFDPGFFERNVLPLFCGLTLDDLKEKSVDALTRDMFYPLKKMQVVVAYDQSVLNGVSGGGLRYIPLPMHVPKGFFHAKLVVVIGKDERGNTIGAVMVGSGNMTLSGWANNVEVVGWTLLNKGHAQELLGFYQYLNKPEELGAASEMLSQISDEQVRPDLFIQYPTHPEGSLYGRLFPKNLSEELHIYSPYWSEKAIREFSLAKLTCYPAKIHQNFQFPVEKQDLGLNGLKIEVQATKGEEQFRHAKAYFWGEYAAIGSANCTFQALHTQGNVEAMLRFNCGKFKLPEAVPLDVWNTDSDNEEGIKPAPLGLLVVADYEKRVYEIDLSVNSNERCSGWVISIGDQKLSEDATHRVLHFEPKKPVVKLFRAEWNGSDGPGYMTGMIIPRGGNDVELGYRPKRKLTRIFDDMLRHRPAGTASSNEHCERGDTDRVPDDSDGDDAAADGESFEFDMYGMYQSFFHLRKDLMSIDSAHDPNSKDDEIADTLLEILQAVKDGEVSNHLQCWLIVQECMDLARKTHNPEKFSSFSSMETELSTGLSQILRDDKELRRYRIEPDSLLNWVRKELGYGS